jgi:transglutaminase-like putative cysteine protease
LRLSIRHTTHYRFDQPVAHGLQRLRLTPKSTQGQAVLEWNMALTGAQFQAEYDDQHHNRTTLVSVDQGVTEVTIACTGLVETSDSAGIIGHHSGFMPMWMFLNQTPLTRPGAKMRALTAQVAAEDTEPLARLHGLSKAVLAAVSYEIGHTNSETQAEEAMVAGHGVCQDHAHIFIGCARALGIPARYVSGYLMMDDRIDQEAGHAWAEAHVDNLGWVGFDISNAISPDARYVRVATGCDYREAAPVTGISWGPGESALKVSLAVEQQLVEQ